MISKELIQKLKETGYKPKPRELTYSEVIMKFNDESKNYNLSDLIEECGDNFSSLINMKRFLKEPFAGETLDVKEDRYWECCGKSEIGETISGTGKTPDIAVANLWLKINKLSTEMLDTGTGTSI